MPYKSAIIIIDRDYSKRYYAFMNEADKKVIEELLDIQAERLEERLEKRMIHVFNEGFEQVVLPHITALNEKVKNMDSRTDRIERKLDAVVERQDRQGEEIESIKKFGQMPEAA